MKSFMKQRLISLLCFSVFMLSLIPAAHADVLWTPDNAFFEAHYEDCTYIGRSYYANGAEGYITLWNTPDGGIVSAQFENAFTLHVYWQYRDWGCVSVFADEKWIDGWVPMSDLVLIYDHISFAEDHADAIRDYNGEFADYTGDSDGIVFWDYPGASSPSMVWDGSDILPQLTGSEDGYSSISQIYVDETGLTWGYVNYLYGRLERWFCLDDPKAETLFTPTEETGDPAPVSSPADPGVVLIPPETPQLPAVSYLPYILVGGVVLVTAGLLIWLCLRRRSKLSYDKKSTNSPKTD